MTLWWTVTEVDNLSYQFGLSEREKQRVDAFGHVVLSDSQARQLSRTKLLCVIITVFVTLWLVTNGAAVAAMISGGGMAFAFKISELFATRSIGEKWTTAETARFVATTCAVQILSFSLFFGMLTHLYVGHY
eukprot:COSAG02_NODE_1277_length_13502_cov_14.551593_10_plen_132_part_00